MRGRKPKPAVLKLIHGSRQPCNPAEPIPEGDLDAPPEFLNDSAKESWRYAIQHAPPGLLKMIDRGVFAIWCMAEARFCQAHAEIDREGMVVTSVKGTPVQSAYMAIASKQATLMLKAASELGFTPTSRTRLSIPTSPRASDEDNPFAPYAGR